MRLVQVAAELGDEVRIVKVDVDEEQGLASHLQVRTCTLFWVCCNQGQGGKVLQMLASRLLNVYFTV